MGKNKSNGNSFFQDENSAFNQMYRSGNMMRNPFDERAMTRQSRERMEYERQLMQQTQRYSPQEITDNMARIVYLEKELEQQLAVEEDEEIYYLLT
jgi:hypothetical protein